MKDLLFAAIFLFVAHRTASAQTTPRTGKDYAVFFYVAEYDKDENGERLTSLPETKTECEKIAAELRDNYGFEQPKIIANASLEQIRATLAAYNEKPYGPDDQVLFFFSMHGFYNTAADRGYLAPRAAKPRDTYRLSWFSYDELGTYLALCPAKHVVLALDACYSGSFGSRNMRGDPGGPDYEQEPDCAQKIRKALFYPSRIFFSSGSKTDKTPGKSLFASRWLEALRSGGEGGVLRKRDLEGYLRKIEDPEPEFGSFKGNEEGGNFVFVRNTACHDGPDPNDDALARDLAAWKNAKAANTPAAYRQYLADFPKGEFREQANAALLNLETQYAQQRDDLAYDVAFQKNTEAAYQKYLADFPSGRHRAEADDKLKALKKTDNMVLVRGGTFQMGSTDGEEDEKPVHTVTLSDFYLSKYEISVGEFRAFIEDSGYQTDAEKDGNSWGYEGKNWTDVVGRNWRHDPEGNPAPDNHPVTNVSWNDATAYCEWLSRKTGKKYRLPTEAEWEYAAGNGAQHTKYSWGNGAPSGKNAGNVADETAANHFSWVKNVSNIFVGYTDGFALNAPIGSFNANDLGFFDMNGNVWEWCSDWYENYSGNEVNRNSPKTPGRIDRGGSWFDSPARSRVSVRRHWPPTTSSSSLGFRLARTN